MLITLSLSFAIGSATGVLKAAQPPAAIALPPGAGADAIEEVCTTCHQISVITAKRRPRSEWEEVLKRMHDEGLAAGADEVSLITDYLTQNFGPPTSP